MTVPDVEQDGFRYYDKWAGNDRGTRENRSRCVAEIGNGSWHTKQCSRQRGYGRDGLFCKQHSKFHYGATL